MVRLLPRRNEKCLAGQVASIRILTAGFSLFEDGNQAAILFIAWREDVSLF